MAQSWKIYVVVTFIVGLLVGAGVGWTMVTPGTVSKSDYDAMKSNYDAAKASLDQAQADLNVATANLNTATANITKTKADLENALKRLDDIKIALVATGGYVPLSTNLTGEVTIGAILSLTGDLATYGENEKVAAEFAVAQVNEFLKAAGANWTLKMVSEDTQTKPDICLQKVESLAARGIKFLVGPLSSAEIRAIKGYLDANKILAVSQSSTAPDLGVDGLPATDDYVLRFAPSDKVGQGPALGRIMYSDGKRYVIPVYRGDAWGDGLEKAATERFAELGGTVLEGVRYAPEAVEFSAEASNLADKVSSAVAAYGADKVAVLHISFEEAVTFFTASNEYAVLKTVKWYGSDGTALAGAVLSDPITRAFALEVDYPSTIFAPTRSAKWGLVRQHGIDVLGREPESYSYAVYDIVWAYALSILTVDKYDAEAVRTVLPTVVKSFFGASGTIELDAAGDRQAGDYDIWAIAEISPGKFDWKHVGVYVLATDSVVWE